MVRKAPLTFCLVFSAHGAFFALEAQEYHVDLEKANQVRFLSDAPLEDFEGTTSRMDGFLYLAEGSFEGAPGSLGASEFYFEVDLASLDTGIGLRNRHMRDNYLETDRYPYATFAGKVLRLESVTGGGFYVTTNGVLSIHGVDQAREISCSANRSGEGFRVNCGFQVKLSDHDIPIPKLMFLKINETMELDLDFYLAPAGEREGTE
jgi:polyisoprenoid-binding protein YceI